MQFVQPGPEFVFWEYNKPTISQRERSDVSWWMKRLYVCVGGEEQGILFWTYLNFNFHIPNQKT